MNERVFKAFPVLDMNDIVLRELRVTDYKPFYTYLSDPMVNRYVSEEDTPKSLERAKEELKYWGNLFHNRRSIYWGIALKNTDMLIGTAGFNVWSRTHRRGEVSYDLARPHWGKGIMTRVLQTICDYGFTAMDINRIQATVAMDNIASIRVLSKVGFQQEGIMRDYGILHGKKKDFYMMSYLQKDLTF